MSSSKPRENFTKDLPNSRLVCRLHGLEVCRERCVDFTLVPVRVDDHITPVKEEATQQTPRTKNIGSGSSYMLPPNIRSLLSLKEPDIKRGVGKIFPTVFHPPYETCTPTTLFPLGVTKRATPPVMRYIHRHDPQRILIYARGTCLPREQTALMAGWAFVFKPTTELGVGHISGRLEDKGPFGDPHTQTNKRAELRAILAALRFRHWRGEGFTTIVLATDSEYVVQGATEGTRTWARNGWKTSTGVVENKDLWEMLLGEAERWDKLGLKIQFWRIPRALNEVADRAARMAAATAQSVEKYWEIRGALV